MQTVVSILHILGLTLAKYLNSIMYLSVMYSAYNIGYIWAQREKAGPIHEVSVIARSGRVRCLLPYPHVWIGYFYASNLLLLGHRGATFSLHQGSPSHLRTSLFVLCVLVHASPYWSLQTDIELLWIPIFWNGPWNDSGHKVCIVPYHANL